MTERRLPVTVQMVLTTLTRAGHEAVLVGGAVRDWLLGRNAADYDVATSAKPDVVQNLFRRTVGTGLQHGTVTVIGDDGRVVEVTTFRAEGTYLDGRRPSEVRFGVSLLEDLQRRDLSINAMAMDVRGQLIDPLGGYADLTSGVIRAVGEPAERFAEDSLRILRALRLAAELSFIIHPDTQVAMRNLSDALARIARERIGAELRKLAAAPWWTQLPELAAGRYFRTVAQPIAELDQAFSRLATSGSVWTDWSHELAMLDTRTALRWSVALWLSAFAHPVTAKQWFRTMAWSLSEAAGISEAIALAGRPLAQLSARDWRAPLFDFGAEACRMAVWLHSHGQRAAVADAALTSYNTACGSQPIWSLRDLAIDGHDVARLGVAQREIGQLLALCKEAVLHQDVTNEKTGLLNLINDDLKMRVRKGVR